MDLIGIPAPLLEVLKQLLRRALLLAAAALIPGCAEDDDIPDSTVLFFDGFDRGDVGADWDVSTGTGTVAVDPSEGAPPPSLAIGLGPGGTFAMAQTRTVFSTVFLRVSVDVKDATAAQGIGGLAIVDRSGQVLASAELSLSPPSQVVFSAGGSTQAALLPIDVDFRTLTFQVDGAGTASWSIAGQIVMTAEGLPAAMVFVRVYERADASAGRSLGTFFFDNVLVTTP